MMLLMSPLNPVGRSRRGQMMTHSAHYPLPQICKVWRVLDVEGGVVIDQADDVAIEHPEPSGDEVGEAR